MPIEPGSAAGTGYFDAPILAATAIRRVHQPCSSICGAGRGPRWGGFDRAALTTKFRRRPGGHGGPVFVKNKAPIRCHTTPTRMSSPSCRCAHRVEGRERPATQSRRPWFPRPCCWRSGAWNPPVGVGWLRHPHGRWRGGRVQIRRVGPAVVAQSVANPRRCLGSLAGAVCALGGRGGPPAFPGFGLRPVDRGAGLCALVAVQ
jgi:hypothetical protein